MITIIEVARFIVGFIILGVAAYSDLHTRTASNKLWLCLSISAIIILLIDFGLNGFDDLLLIVMVGIILLVYILFQLKVISGGADAKAMMSLTVLIPFFVLDVILFACIITFIVLGIIWLVRRSVPKGYPFLLSLFSSFIIVFFLSNFWSVLFMELLLGDLFV